jgi:hypothetical protein
MKVMPLQSHVALYLTCAPVIHVSLQIPKDPKGIQKSKGGRPRKGAKYNVRIVAWVSAAVFRVVLILFVVFVRIFFTCFKGSTLEGLRRRCSQNRYISLHFAERSCLARSLNASRCAFLPCVQWCHKVANFLKRGVHVLQNSKQQQNAIIPVTINHELGCLF